MTKKYTHIFFDLDNTLWDFISNSRMAMLEVFRVFSLEGQGIDFENFFTAYEEFNTNLWAVYRKKQIAKKELIRSRFQLTFDALGINGVDPLEMNELYLGLMPQQTTMVDGAPDLLKQLNRQGYQLFIITNGFAEVQYKKIERAGFAPLFKKVFISEEIKVPKPGKKIFEYAIKSSNARKSKSLMIGDDWEADVLGALNFGIDAVYYSKDTANEKNRNLPPNIQNTCYEVDSLLAIPEILSKKDTL